MANKITIPTRYPAYDTPPSPSPKMPVPTATHAARIGKLALCGFPPPPAQFIATTTASASCGRSNRRRTVWRRACLSPRNPRYALHSANLGARCSRRKHPLSALTSPPHRADAGRSAVVSAWSGVALATVPSCPACWHARREAHRHACPAAPLLARSPAGPYHGGLRQPPRPAAAVF
jgi:hypothetical protein